MQPAPEKGIHLWWIVRALILLVSLSGWGGSSRTVTLDQIEELRTMESLLPIVADSVVERYERYEPALFYVTYGDLVRGATAIVDSLNRPLPGSLRIDTLAIDHTFESLGEAARQGRTLYLPRGISNTFWTSISLSSTNPSPATNRRRNGNLVLLNPQPVVRLALEKTGIPGVIGTYDTLDAALTAVRTERK